MEEWTFVQNSLQSDSDSQESVVNSCDSHDSHDSHESHDSQESRINIIDIEEVVETRGVEESDKLDEDISPRLGAIRRLLEKSLTDSSSGKVTPVKRTPPPPRFSTTVYLIFGTGMLFAWYTYWRSSSTWYLTPHNLSL